MIKALVFSYQNKNLKKVVDQLIQNTKNEIFILIFDKHTIDRSSIFNSPNYKNRVEYTHIFWDEIIGPAEYKANMINNNNSEYFLYCSDDVLVSKDWDEALINLLKDQDVIISGKGQLSLNKKDLFFFEQVRTESVDFTLSNFIDRNFIFGKSDNLKQVYPKEVKYHGDEEILSLNLYNKKIEIISGPSNLYEDLKVRSIDNSYTTFSIEHGYNIAIEKYLAADPEFLKFHGINPEDLNKLPYNADDVSYHPYQLNFQDMDSRKFLLPIKEIS